MARALGAPTRIAVGYAASSRRTGEETIVRGKDLHAWPEIYFDDQGWVAFEPTPGGAGLRADEGRDVPRTPPYTPTTEPTRTSAPPSQRPTKSPERPDTDPAKNPTTTSGDGIDPATIVLWSLPLLAVILLLLPAGWRLRRRQRRVRAIARGDAPAQRAWAEFSDTLADLGLLGSAPGDGGGGGDAERGSENPRAPRARTPGATLEHLEALGVLTGQPAAAARELASAMAAERYGDGAADAVATARLLELARGGLLAGATSGVRARAALAPRSLLRRAPH
ncbi:MAG: transglutaminase domain-containing protein, partial [Actinobacteria bacterium]|nr:transglutaminase domain-containing protein [Actinomycetota bacterium]